MLVELEVKPSGPLWEGVAPARKGGAFSSLTVTKTRRFVGMEAGMWGSDLATLSIWSMVTSWFPRSEPRASSWLPVWTHTSSRSGDEVVQHLTSSSLKGCLVEHGPPSPLNIDIRKSLDDLDGSSEDGMMGKNQAEEWISGEERGVMLWRDGMKKQK